MESATMTVEKPPTTVLVTGGGGFLGFNIIKDFAEKGYSGVIFDIQGPKTQWVDGLKEDVRKRVHIRRGDLTSFESLLETFEEFHPQIVVHCASFGMSGIEQMPWYWDQTERVNIDGTRNVLNACAKHNVRALVFTSTFNVVFGGQQIEDGDESLPYFPLHRHWDKYSMTKSVAEQLVLMADHKGSLRTCALRLAGLMGPQETRHLPRFVESLPKLKFRYSPESKTQFLSIWNAVDAHVKASLELYNNPEGQVSGQAYFISDGVAVNNFDYFRPIFEGLGYPYPAIIVPLFLTWFFVLLLNFLQILVGKIHPLFQFPPFITPCELYKTSVTHYFRINKARNHFGYEPRRPNDTEEILEYCKGLMKFNNKSL